MAAVSRKVLADIEDNTMRYRAKDPAYIKASNLRMDFFRNYIINRNTTLYKTTVERDFAYIALREYRYEVTIKSAGYAFITGCAALSCGIFRAKKMVVWPFMIALPAFPYFRQYFFYKTNKRLFDMCNVGDEYELGHARNEVLRECNRILDVEDF